MEDEAVTCDHERADVGGRQLCDDRLADRPEAVLHDEEP